MSAANDAFIAASEPRDQRIAELEHALREAADAMRTVRGLAFGHVQVDAGDGSLTAWWAYFDAARRLAWGTLRAPSPPPEEAEAPK